jgi:hypothetical protein
LETVARADFDDRDVAGEAAIGHWISTSGAPG